MVETKRGASSLEILEGLGAKPSESEERGLALIEDSELNIFCPGISSAGFAEIRMARANKYRKVIATTIDEKGLVFADKVISEVGLQNQIETRLEDLRGESNYPDNYFDRVYARLVLHYLSEQDLDKVLGDFWRVLKPEGKLYVVVRSVKNIPDRDDVKYDEKTKPRLLIIKTTEKSDIWSRATFILRKVSVITYKSRDLISSTQRSTKNSYTKTS
jgi:ubiquinone/menaquinone biosynthesis C-methylase UbiE